MTENLAGGCLCGAVRYQCNAAPVRTLQCYCTDCRRIGSTGHATHSIFPDDAFSITGTVTEYAKTSDSGNLINRRFCPVCGSALYHTLDSMPGVVIVRASSLDDPEAAVPDMAIYVSRALSWDPANKDLRCFEEMAVRRKR